MSDNCSLLSFHHAPRDVEHEDVVHSVLARSSSSFPGVIVNRK